MTFRRSTPHRHGGAVTLHATASSVRRHQLEEPGRQHHGDETGVLRVDRHGATAPHTELTARLQLGNFANIQHGKPLIAYGVNGPDGSGPQQSTLTVTGTAAAPSFHLVGPTYYNDPDTGKWLTAHLDIVATCGSVATVTS